MSNFFDELDRAIKGGLFEQVLPPEKPKEDEWLWDHNNPGRLCKDKIGVVAGHGDCRTIVAVGWEDFVEAMCDMEARRDLKP